MNTEWVRLCDVSLSQSKYTGLALQQFTRFIRLKSRNAPSPKAQVSCVRSKRLLRVFRTLLQIPKFTSRVRKLRFGGGRYVPRALPGRCGLRPGFLGFPLRMLLLLMLRAGMYLDSMQRNLSKETFHGNVFGLDGSWLVSRAACSWRQIEFLILLSI